MGIGIEIEGDVAGIGILVSSISVQYCNIQVPDWVTLIPIAKVQHFTKLHKGTSSLC
jgi:hypothetical protein